MNKDDSRSMDMSAVHSASFDRERYPAAHPCQLDNLLADELPTAESASACWPTSYGQMKEQEFVFRSKLAMAPGVITAPAPAYWNRIPGTDGGAVYSNGPCAQQGPASQWSMAILPASQSLRPGHLAFPSCIYPVQPCNRNRANSLPVLPALPAQPCLPNLDLVSHGQGWSERCSGPLEVIPEAINHPPVVPSPQLSAAASTCSSVCSSASFSSSSGTASTEFSVRTKCAPLLAAHDRDAAIDSTGSQSSLAYNNRPRTSSGRQLDLDASGHLLQPMASDRSSRPLPSWSHQAQQRLSARPDVNFIRGDPHSERLAVFVASMVYIIFWHGSDEYTALLHQHPLEPACLMAVRYRQLPCQASPDFIHYTKCLLETMQISCSTALLSLFYLHRLRPRVKHLFVPDPAKSLPTNGRSRCQYRRDPQLEFRLSTIALVLANKYLDDNSYSNKAWSDVTGLDLRKLNIMEQEFMRYIDYRLVVREREYVMWVNWLERLIHTVLDAASEVSCESTYPGPQDRRIRAVRRSSVSVVRTTPPASTKEKGLDTSEHRRAPTTPRKFVTDHAIPTPTSISRSSGHGRHVESAPSTVVPSYQSPRQSESSRDWMNVCPVSIRPPVNATGFPRHQASIVHIPAVQLKPQPDRGTNMDPFQCHMPETSSPLPSPCGRYHQRLRERTVSNVGVPSHPRRMPLVPSAGNSVMDTFFGSKDAEMSRTED